jgi:hypothetical protein
VWERTPAAIPVLRPVRVLHLELVLHPVLALCLAERMASALRPVERTAPAAP